MIHELFVPKGRNDVRRACRIGMSGRVKNKLFHNTNIALCAKDSAEMGKHMKTHILVMVITMVTLLALTSCGNSSQEDSGNTNATTSQENSAGNQTDASKGNESGAAVPKDGKVLVAYFAVAENSDVDAILSASVSDVNGEKKEG